MVRPSTLVVLLAGAAAPPSRRSGARRRRPAVEGSWRVEARVVDADGGRPAAGRAPRWSASGPRSRCASPCRVRLRERLPGGARDGALPAPRRRRSAQGRGGHAAALRGGRRVDGDLVERFVVSRAVTRAGRRSRRTSRARPRIAGTCAGAPAQLACTGPRSARSARAADGGLHAGAGSRLAERSTAAWSASRTPRTTTSTAGRSWAGPGTSATGRPPRAARSSTATPRSEPSGQADGHGRRRPDGLRVRRGHRRTLSAAPSRSASSAAAERSAAARRPNGVSAIRSPLARPRRRG